MSVTMTFDALGVIAMLDAMSAGLVPAIRTGLATVSELVAEVMREKAPVGVGGVNGLKGSIGYILNPESLTSEIKPSVSYADAVETGSKPHWIPIEALKPWAELKGINPWAVQASIAKKGTMPHPYIEPTYEETQDEVGSTMNGLISAFLGVA